MANPEVTLDIATAFVHARRSGKALTGFPGPVPVDSQSAYACQDAAIKQWPDKIAGWKVGLVPPSLHVSFRSDRLVGPVFQQLLQHNTPQMVLDCAVFEGGFAAIEAEFVFRIAKDTPAYKHHWTIDEAVDYVAALHAGVEIASSPLATINALGPAVVVSDFGNNHGLIVGSSIMNWHARSTISLTCESFIDGALKGKGSAASIPGGPLASLAFAMGKCAERGYPLLAGQYICTGAATGIHEIHTGQAGRIIFTDICEIQCRAVAVSPA